MMTREQHKGPGGDVWEIVKADEKNWEIRHGGGLIGAYRTRREARAIVKRFLLVEHRYRLIVRKGAA